MKLDANQVNQIKELIENNCINSIIQYAQKTYPAECCGFILETGVVLPAQNVIEVLYDSTLTRRDAFLIDSESWKLATMGANRIMCIYHSHTNGDSNMSKMDKSTLKWEEIFYLVIGLVDSNPTSAKLFWWHDDNLNELNIKI